MYNRRNQLLRLCQILITQKNAHKQYNLTYHSRKSDLVKSVDSLRGNNITNYLPVLNCSSTSINSDLPEVLLANSYRIPNTLRDKSGIIVEVNGLKRILDCYIS